MRWRYCWLLAAVLVWTGCGKEERREATSLVKVLGQKQADLAAINALEKDLLGSTRSWCESIINAGGGKDKELTENATSAKALAESAGAVSAQLGTLRQAIYDQPLKQEYPQEVRGTVLSQLMKRQRMLQDIRTALDTSAAGFLAFGQTRSYKGDTYPPSIDKLYSIVSGYVGPEDTMGKAIKDLKVKYTIDDADITGKT